MDRYLGLDVGQKTIGISISDEMGWTAQGIEVLKRDLLNPDKDLEAIKAYINNYNIKEIIVGLPKNMNGTIGPSGEMCTQFADTLKEQTGCPVRLWDERLTTVAAERLLVSADVTRKKRKKVVDKMAASLILQGYLDFKK
jgi:putative Holliday junction resolvase